MHIFSIPDEVETPEDAAGLAFLGRIDLRDHMSARGMWAKAEQEGLLIHPFEDTRLTYKQVQELLVVSLSNHANRELSAILKDAISRQAGIISFCD